MAAFQLNGPRLLIACAGAALIIATSAAAQDNGRAEEPEGPVNSSQALRLPENPQIFGTAMPSVVKATAIVNGDVITQTDVGQRLALMAIANSVEIPAAEVERLSQQVLRNLIDESLEIQAAKSDKIEIKKADVDRTLLRVAQNMKKSPDELGAYLEAHGSNIKTLRRQIEAEIAWRRLQQDKIESSVSVGDDEVKAVIDKLNASKGTEEFRVGEIFLSATPATQNQILDNAGKILSQLRNGASFAAYARQYSEASTAAVGGDLGWVRPEQLPASLADVVRQMEPGAISNPIPVPGGFSILAIQDTRKILTADPRDAALTLKQLQITFPKGTTQAQAEPIVNRFAEATRNIGGCGGADKIAADFHAQLVTPPDQIKMRDLPPAMQRLLLPLQVGQATQPFGTMDEGIRVLVVCGRDQIDQSAPTYDDIYSQLNEERVNSRAQRYLRDLRRDAVLEYR